MKAAIDWLDQRTGVRKLTKEALFENIPGGSRWRYVWGSTLTFALVVQFVTGIFLWMAYSPGAQSAWESVYYIQNEMSFGWVLRGIHHYTAQLMTVLLVLHLMQTVIDGAYKAPREVNFWFGILLLLLVLGLSLTGYLLPWDQKGYWSTKVATSIAGSSPVIGPSLQRLIIGGADYGHHTLSRFFAFHAGVLPAAVIALLVGHIYLFRRHGITAKKPLRRPDAAFWPDQVLKDAVACLAVLATVLFFVIRNHGADLGAPADPGEEFSAARPDWYFLFLFQFLKYFPGKWEILGAIVIPTFALLLIFFMPVLGRWRLGHRFNLAVLGLFLAGFTLLTYLAIAEDRKNPTYLAAVKNAEQSAKRVVELAKSSTGISPAGAAELLRADPLSQGPRLFQKNCASCHRFNGHDGMGNIVSDPSSAPDLAGFASRKWLAGLLDPAQIDSSNYFGGTKFAQGKMSKYVKKELSNLTPEKQQKLTRVIAALSAEATLHDQRNADAADQQLIREGTALIKGEFSCTDCHAFQKPDDDATAVDLTGYGSRDWVIRFIANPKHESFYGKRNDRMPAFADDGILDQRAIGLVADWLRGDWYRGDNGVSTNR